MPIEYAILYVSSDHDGGPDDPVPPTPDQVVVALPRSTLAIASACSDHEAQATLERWTGEPPSRPIRADEPERGTDRSGTGEEWELRRDLAAEHAPPPGPPVCSPCRHSSPVPEQLPDSTSGSDGGSAFVVGYTCA